MTTTQAVRMESLETNQSSWSRTFPTEQSTEQQSALFVKKLLAVAISNITYLRAIFSEGAYSDRCLEDLKLKILRDDNSCPGACQVIQWVKGCFDALEKKYLRMLIIGIYENPDDPDTVIESYTFKFNYSEDGDVNMFRNGKKVFHTQMAQETQKATRSLLRTIVVLTQSLPPLPENVMMTMKLLYYDEATPAEYEPPGFIAADKDNFEFQDEPMNINAGCVNTPFHTVKLRVKTDRRHFESAEPEEEAGQEQEQSQEQSQEQEQEEEEVEGEVMDEGLDQEVDGHNLEETSDQEGDVYGRHDNAVRGQQSGMVQGEDSQVVPSEEPAEALSLTGGYVAALPGSAGRAISTTGSTQLVEAASDHGDSQVRCACGCNEDDGLMILCEKCLCWQHGVCYKVLGEDQAPTRHICDLCADSNRDDAIPTDPHLNSLTDIARQATCLWRRALVACSEMNRVVGHTLMKALGVELPVANGLMRRLEKEGFLKAGNAKGKRLGRAVDKDKLKNEGMKKYFKKSTPRGSEDVNNNNKGGPDEEDQSEEVSNMNEKNKIDTEIAKLTAQAEDLDLSGTRRGLDTSAHSGHGTRRGLDTTGHSGRGTRRGLDTAAHSGHGTQSGRAGEGRGMKRVKPIHGEAEFELSNSQDASRAPGRPKKRRKSSNIRRPLAV